MEQKFQNITIDDIIVGEPLPAPIYLYIDLRYIIFRAKGDVVDRSVHERLEMRKITNLYVMKIDHQKLKDWKTTFLAKTPKLPDEAKDLSKLKKELHRATLDIFLSEHPNEAIKKAVSASKKVATEVMKAPLSVKALAQLQTFSSNSVCHSMNVSILSTYLALQMGYSHLPILQHLATGSLLHDIGKLKIKLEDIDSPEVNRKKMEQHPLVGVEYLQSENPALAQEVVLIIAQHHELHDGTGYPRKLRGNAIYDLARIVSLANTFDELVANCSGTLQERQKKAVKQLGEMIYHNKFEPDKHQKVLRILDLGV